MANYTRIQLRGDTKANWLSVNPILAKNEPAIETDTNRFKIGDGVSTYLQLSYGRNTVEYSSLYNVTSLFPLPSGYYSHESAVLAIPVGERAIGLIITYETESGVWYTERFIGTNVSGWTTVSNWERLPNASDVSRLDSNISNTNSHIANKSNPHEVTKAQVGLGNVDNTSDIDKPISTLQQAAITATTNAFNGHVANTSNPHSVTKSQVGLSNVDNTSDSNKPISSATQTALNGKVNNSGNEAISGIKTFEASPIVPTPTTDMQSSTKKYVDDAKSDIQSKQIVAGAGLTGGGTISSDRTLDVISANDGITVNADNIQLNAIDSLLSTSTTKPLSANQGRIIDVRLSSAESDIDDLQADVIGLDSNITTANSHIANKSNPHQVTKAQVGLGNVDNTSDIDKPISTLQQAAITATTNAFNGHVANTSNPHEVTKAQIGVGNVDNTSDSDKPISIATQIALDSKADLVGGKVPAEQLSSYLALGETSSTAYQGDRGKIAYDHSQLTNANPHNTNASQIPNTPAGNIQSVTVQGAINEIDNLITELGSQILVYGVEFTRGLDPAMTRWIGDTVYQSSHPVLAMFKVAKVKDGKVTGFFNQVNLFKMEDGTDSNIIIDGTIVTDDGSDVMLVNTEPIYVLNGGTNETYERRLVCKMPFVYDGDAAIEIPAHGVCIDYSTIKDGKQRSIRDNTVAGTGGAGVGGISYLANGLGGIKAEVSRFNYELYARAKNTDTSKNVPYCNSFWLDIDVWHTLLCIKFKTKDYHGSAYAGKALSSNDSAPTVSTWGTMTGVRVRETNATFRYYNLSSNRFSSASGQSTVDFWSLINGQRPLLKMFEAQLALSYAYASSIAPNTDFSYDGATYRYANITGHNGLVDGEMTAKLRKKVTVSFTGRDVTDSVDVTNMQIDYLLEQVIIKGRVATWGHLYTWNSGIDAWTDNTNYHFYHTLDINKVMTDTDSAEKELGVKYAFEDAYQKVQQIARSDGWTLLMNNRSLIIKTDGGSLHTGECAYSYRSGAATTGKKARKGVSFGGNATYSYASSRVANATYSPTYTNTDFAGGFRVELIK